MQRVRATIRWLLTRPDKGPWLLLGLAVIGATASGAVLGHDVLSNLRNQGLTAFDRDENGQYGSAWLLLPLIATWLGVTGGSLGLLSHARRRLAAIPASANKARVAGDVVAELRLLLAQQQEELIVMQRATATLTQDSLVAGARLKTFTLEAEDRLNKCASQITASLSESPPILDRALETLQRIETIAPNLYDTSRQINTLAEVIGVLQRESTGLSDAGRHIAAVGAHVVTRVSDAVTQMDVAVASLPDLTGSAVTLVREASEAMSGTVATLRETEAALDASGRSLQHVISVVQSEAELMRDAGAQLGERAAAAESMVESAFAVIPEFSQSIEAQAAQLAHTADETNKAVVQFAALAAQIETDLARLPANLEGAVGSLHEARSILDRLQDGTQTIIDTTQLSVARVQASAETVTEGLLQSVDSLRGLVGSLNQAPALEQDVPDWLKRLDEMIMQALERQAQQSRSSVAETSDLVAQLRTQMELLRETIQPLMQSRSDPVADVSVSLDRVLAEIHKATGATSRAVQELHGSVETVVGLTQGIGAEIFQLRRTTIPTDAISYHVPGLADQSMEHFLVEMLKLVAEVRGAISHDHLQQSLLTRVGLTDIARLESATTPLTPQIEALSERLDHLASLLPSHDQFNNLSQTITTLTRIGADLSPLLMTGSSAGAAISDIPDMLRHQADAHVSALEQFQNLARAFVADAARFGDRLDAATELLEVTNRKMATASTELVAAVTDIVPALHSANLAGNVTPSLDRFSGLAHEIGQLIVASEQLAQAALEGRTSQPLVEMAGSSAEILGVVDTMIRGLRSVGTAVALASDTAARSASRGAA
jgi:archaellum component FlaC